MSATESTASTAGDASTESGMAAKNPARRRRSLLLVASVFILAGLAWWLLWLFVFSTRVKTDNAYVGGNQVAISAQVPGTVVAILADNTQRVLAGQVLVKLDRTDADIRLQQARSALARAVRGISQQDSAAQAADAGRDATIPLLARKGRASYLGERSVGHQDPGATSTALLIAAAVRAVG